jgi:hypothetical protein
MWVGVDQYNPTDMCPICHDDYGTTQAIFKTPCGHFFHNNCLLDYCDANQGDIECPMCRSDIAEYCNDVYAFKERVLGNQNGSPLFEGNEHVLNIYNNQSGGKKRRNTRKRNTKKRNTRKRNTKKRNTKKRNTRKRNKKNKKY